jgi:cytochrome c oxidase assembly protein subunit 15
MNGLRSAIAKVFPPRALFILAVLAAAATWIMLLIGGTVNPTGSSLACTDWSFTWGFVPLCNGDAFPSMTGGVLYEHGHRLWGWLVGLFTTATLIGAWAAADVAPRTRWMALGAFLLVIAQGGLGGLTVLLGLNPWLSTAHLVVGYSFLALMVYIAWRLTPSRRAEPTRGAFHPRGFLVAAILLTLAQIVLGGVIRHFGAGMICGTDPVGCSGQGLWPDLGLQQLHMTHRFLGYGVLLVVIYAAIRARNLATTIQRPHVATLALLPIALVATQVTLGLVTVVSGKIVWVVTLHTAIGGLLLASLTATWVGFGPLGQRLVRPAFGRDPGARESAA